MMRLRLAAMALALSSAPAAAQGTGARTNAWLAAVRTHQGGELDDAFDDDREMVARRRPGGDRGRAGGGRRDAHGGPRPPHRHRDGRARAGRHQARGRFGRRHPPDRRPGCGTRRALEAWEIGRQIAQALLAREGGEPVARRWYRAAGALLQQWGDCATLRLHDEAGLAALKDDAILALYEGTRHQLYADPRVQAFVSGARRRGGTRGMLVMGDGMNSGTLEDSGTFAGYVRRPTGGRLIDEDVMKPGKRHPFAPQAPAIELDSAERELRRALGLNPRLTEATIRLAHVLLAKGRAQEAAELVRPLASPSLPPFLDFYAALVLGRSTEKLGQPAEARAAYERAVARFPNAQSARIALSRVVVADGRTGDGFQTVVAVVGPKMAPGIDPWSAYFRFHDPDASTLLAALKAGVK